MLACEQCQKLLPEGTVQFGTDGRRFCSRCFDEVQASTLLASGLAKRRRARIALAVFIACLIGAWLYWNLRPLPRARYRWIGTHIFFSIPELVSGEVSLDGVDYVVTFEGLPSRTIIKSGDQEQKASGTWTRRFDRSAVLRDLPSSYLSKEISNGAKIAADGPLVIEFPRRGSLKLELPAITFSWHEVDESLKRVKEGKPFLFKGETATPIATHSALLFVPNEVVGPAKTFGEIDWLVFTEHVKEERRGTTPCAYEEQSTRRRVSVSVTLIDERVAIYDRRLGKLVDQTVISAHDGCPLSAGGRFGMFEAKNYANSRDVRAWVEQRVQAP